MERDFPSMGLAVGGERLKATTWRRRNGFTDQPGLTDARRTRHGDRGADHLERHAQDREMATGSGSRPTSEDADDPPGDQPPRTTADGPTPRPGTLNRTNSGAPKATRYSTRLTVDPLSITPPGGATDSIR